MNHIKHISSHYTTRIMPFDYYEHHQDFYFEAIVISLNFHRVCGFEWTTKVGFSLKGSTPIFCPLSFFNINIFPQSTTKSIIFQPRLQ